MLLLGARRPGDIDRMFPLRAPRPGAANLKHAWASAVSSARSSSASTACTSCRRRPTSGAEGARGIRDTLRRSSSGPLPGLVILDTKSDLEALTRNALRAADPSSCRSRTGRRSRRPARRSRCSSARRLGDARGRILFTLVDRRTPDRRRRARPLRAAGAAVDERGWARYGTVLSRSPRVEALNSADRERRSRSCTTRGHRVHASSASSPKRSGKILDLGEPEVAVRARARRALPRSLVNELRGVLLRGLARALAPGSRPSAISPSNTFSAGPSMVRVEVGAHANRKAPARHRHRELSVARARAHGPPPPTAHALLPDASV